MVDWLTDGIFANPVSCLVKPPLAVTAGAQINIAPHNISLNKYLILSQTRTGWRALDGDADGCKKASYVKYRTVGRSVCPCVRVL